VTAPPTPSSDGLGSFYASLDKCHLQPLWTQNRELMPLVPQPATLAWRWDRRTLHDRVKEAGRVVPIDRGGDRRVLALSNPGLGTRPFATSTLWGAVQYLGPHEGAPAHRHSQGAVRFILEGSGVWTTVDGDAIEMKPGDLVLTPAWTWHDHRSNSDEPMIWFDGLDMPLVSALDAPFFELYPSNSYQEILGHDLTEAGFDGSGGSYVTNALPPSADEAHSPLLVYRWEATDAALDAQLREHPSASLDVVSPSSGRSVTPTLGCRFLRVPARVRTPPVQATGSSIFVVRSGTGASVVSGLEMTWAPGDIFVTPSWSIVEHHAVTTADLFVVTDRPALEALHLYREQTHDRAQSVERRFDG
jgi:gentisate 1,2-dioxygenase